MKCQGHGCEPPCLASQFIFPLTTVPGSLSSRGDPGESPLRLMHHTADTISDTISRLVFPPQPCVYLCFPSSAEQQQFVSFSPISVAPRLLPADGGAGDGGTGAAPLCGSTVWLSLCRVVFLHPLVCCGCRGTRPGHRMTEQLKGWKTHVGSLGCSPCSQTSPSPTQP